MTDMGKLSLPCRCRELEFLLVWIGWRPNHHIDLLQTVENFNSDGLYNASRFTYQKAERSFKESGTPWVMALIGHIDDFDGFGPQFDLSTTPVNRLNEDDDLEDI